MTQSQAAAEGRSSEEEEGDGNYQTGLSRSAESALILSSNYCAGSGEVSPQPGRPSLICGVLEVSLGTSLFRVPSPRRHNEVSGAPGASCTSRIH